MQSEPTFRCIGGYHWQRARMRFIPLPSYKALRPGHLPGVRDPLLRSGNIEFFAIHRFTRKKNTSHTPFERNVHYFFIVCLSHNKLNPSLYFFSTTHHYPQEQQPLAERCTQRRIQQGHTQELARRQSRYRLAPQQPAPEQQPGQQLGQPQPSHPVFHRVVNILSCKVGLFRGDIRSPEMTAVQGGLPPWAQEQ